MKNSATLPEDRPSTLSGMRPIVRRITRKYGVRNVRIFGSFARGEQRKTSDVDLLVDLPDDMSLLDLSGLKIDLEEALHRRVDVVPNGAIKPALRERILAEARIL
jgi:predicted nucleotidyltransferase